MRATLDSRIRTTDLSSASIAELHDLLSYENPEWTQAQRAGRTPAWSMPPRTISMLGDDGETVSIPRGAAKALRSIVGAIEWTDVRVVAPHEWTVHRELRAEQREAVSALVRAQQGFAVAPPGTGKTTIGLGAIEAAGQTALFVVPTVDLVRQTADEARAVLGVEPAIIANGQESTGPLTIATFASMRDPARRARLYPLFGTIVVDEAHGIGSPENARIADESPAKNRFFLSATPHTDARGFVVRQLVGPVVWRAQTADLVEAGRLREVRREEISTTFTYVGDASEWSQLVSAVVACPERNALITRLVARECRNALGLVLSLRVAHARLLGSAIADHGLRVGVLTGDVPAKERAQILAAARAGDLDVLVATTLADEGLDLPQLSRLFLTVPSREGARFTQRVGRAMRVHPGKQEPVVFDFVDEHVGLLRHQARKRAAAFAAMWMRAVAA